ncbi:prenyltransferase/squalene oxidase repeat-containing protein [Micromonospora sp. WMMD734]|uniref:prenyltransferase/squalene oxidase repeat-containing protein n=1 Tax=Micromonospora sp. WMMD734 TaxID=3404129 RepID=UPI003B93803F
MDRTTIVRTGDGGVRQGGADLWCTYAAVRTLAWLGRRPGDVDACVEYLRSCQNHDGGFAWQRGLPSDVWATYYCTQALRDLGAEVPRVAELTRWLPTLQHDSGGFAMMPGQHPDVWATYYALRTAREVLSVEPADVGALRDWLGRLQHADGGLGWYPGATGADVRACYYGAMAWRAASGTAAPPWTPALLTWINQRQTPAGGYAFADPDSAPCLWATFRAVRALDALGGRPERAADCRAWIAARATPAGYLRWDGYRTADVWAGFSAVGALQTLDVPVPLAASIPEFLASCELPEGGFTYRHSAMAGDSLATAAALLLETVQARPDAEAVTGYADWLVRAHLPYEGGVMYMPGRGAEVRCTLWAVAGLKAAGRGLPEADRVVDWCRRIQNSDGGFGYWEGRASDMAATASAAEVVTELGAAVDVLNTRMLGAFVASCATPQGYRHTPQGPVSCAATAQAARVLDLIGESEAAARAAGQLAGFASRLGGFAAAERGVPDLVSTYQAVLTHQVLGQPVDVVGLDRFLDKTRVGSAGYAWGPLSRRSGGVLATAMGTRLATGARLPRLNL